jgi:choline dehydrogenase-like flavoprotein
MFCTGWLQASIGNGTRSTSSTAYLSPVNGRPNLHVLLNAHVTQIIQTGQLYEKPVFGSVAFNVSGKSYTATARKEIILSAGSLNTPQLLLLSGLGPKEELSALGIKTIVDLPSVGKNVSDHALVYNV